MLAASTSTSLTWRHAAAADDAVAAPAARRHADAVAAPPRGRAAGAPALGAAASSAAPTEVAPLCRLGAARRRVHESERFIPGFSSRRPTAAGGASALLSALSWRSFFAKTWWRHASWIISAAHARRHRRYCATSRPQWPRYAACTRMVAATA